MHPEGPLGCERNTCGVHRDDLVDYEGQQYVVLALHEDRSVSLSFEATERRLLRRVLLRDCRLVTPQGAFREKKTLKRKGLELLSSADDCRLDARGVGSMNRRKVPVAPWSRCSLADAKDRQGCHYLLTVGLSEAVPEGMEVTRLELEANGMDQGWGNTGRNA